jgi:hypothetical protein
MAVTHALQYIQSLPVACQLFIAAQVVYTVSFIVRRVF